VVWKKVNDGRKGLLGEKSLVPMVERAWYQMDGRGGSQSFEGLPADGSNRIWKFGWGSGGMRGLVGGEFAKSVGVDDDTVGIAGREESRVLSFGRKQSLRRAIVPG
jgi:hypothetical protein